MHQIPVNWNACQGGIWWVQQRNTLGVAIKSSLCMIVTYLWPVGVGIFTLADHKCLSHPGICLLAATLNDCVHWGLVWGGENFLSWVKTRVRVLSLRCCWFKFRAWKKANKQSSQWIWISESGLELIRVLECGGIMNGLNGPIFERICYLNWKRNGISLTVSA